MPINKRIAVVGSGPGGGLSAALLAEAGHAVTIYDEGPVKPDFAADSYSPQEVESCYRQGGITAAFGRPKITYVEGRVVGGGSEINAGLYHRLPSETLQRWRESHLFSVHESELEPFYRLNEEELKVQPLPVAQIPRPSRRLQQGASVLGWKCVEVPRWFSPHNGSFERQSISRIYIPRALNCGATLKSNTRVLRLRHSQRSWEIQSQQGGRLVNEKFDAVIVAGGAIQTPWLLRRSGWRRRIGERLYCHPTLKVIAEFPEEVNSRDMGVGVHQVKEFAPAVSFGCSVSLPQALGIGMLDHRQHLPYVLQNWRRHTIYYCMINGQSFGQVRAPTKEAIVRYQFSLADGERLFRGLGDLCRLLFNADAVKLYPSIEKSPVITSQNMDFFAHSATGLHNQLQLSTVHLMGGCAMGENEKLCATDSFGRLRDADNLWVNDGSMLCTSMGVNPQGAIMALTRRNCMKLLGEL